MNKIYILDTNVLLHDPKALLRFEDNEVVLPLIVLEELDKKKQGVDEVNRNARETIRVLDRARANGSISDGVKTDNGGLIRIEMGYSEFCPPDLDKNKPDNKIIATALGLMQKELLEGCRKVIVVSKDINLRVKCDVLKILVEDYNADQVAINCESIYSGIVELKAAGLDIEMLHSVGEIDASRFGALFPNQYVHLISETNDKHTGLARYENGKLVKIKTFPSGIWGITSRNKEQACALDALFNPAIKLVSLIGRSGGGKTLLAAVAGVSQLLDNHVYKKLILTRPVTSMGSQAIGFLPGSLEEKMSPWLAPLRDNLELIFSEKGAESYLEMQMESGLIQVEALSYIRGRSIPKSLFIVDECQNLTSHEIKTIITRIGDGSKILLTGDIEQVDTPFLDAIGNGLTYVVEKFKHYPISAHITLTKGERSELATLAANIL